MVVGLGSGSTARQAVLRIGEKLRTGALGDIVAIPTSETTARLAEGQGIPLTTLGDHPQVDVTIDGADEVDPELNLIKGLGGFLLHEKIVASATITEIIVVDNRKLVQRLGAKSPVPVEVVRFGWQNTERALGQTGARTRLRLVDEVPFVTDEGNHIIDCKYDRLESPAQLATILNAIPGVVENGLFLGVAEIVVVASPGEVRILER